MINLSELRKQMTAFIAERGRDDLALQLILSQFIEWLRKNQLDGETKEAVRVKTVPGNGSGSDARCEGQGYAMRQIF